MIRLHIYLASCLFCAACSPDAELANFNKPEKVTVNGRVLNPLPDTKIISLSINRLGLGQEEIESEIGKEGLFHFQFETYTPTDIWLTYQTNLLFIVHPGDSMFLEFDGSKADRPEVLETIKFHGDRDSTNIQIAAFQKAYYARNHNWQNEQYAIKHYNPEEFKAYADTIRLKQITLYNNFLKTYSPNDEAAKWALFFLDRNHFRKLTDYPNSHRKAMVLKESEWNVPFSYYNYIKTTKPISGSLVSADAIFDMTNRYLYTYVRRIVNEKLINHEETDSEYIKDSIFLQTIGEYTSDPLFKEIAITQYVNDKLSGLNSDVYQRNLNFINKNVTERFLKEPLIKRYNELSQKLKELPIPENASIQNIEDSGNTFISKIIEDNIGSVIYIDIWATWCGPCLEEFPYSKKLQTELKDVTFAYLCIESQETPFHNTIKRFQLEGQHYFLNETQSKALRKELHIDGIPHHLLIDRNGKVVNSNYALHPSSDNTKKEIEKLLASEGKE